LGVDAQYRRLVTDLTLVPEFLPPGDLAKAAPASACAFFLDVDGTLLDIRPRPEDVLADPQLRALLLGLQGAADGALALVSGRKIDDIDRIFAPLIFTAAGLHGAEIRFPDGSRIAAQGGAMDPVRPTLRDFVARHPGLRLEDKGATLAVHFRQRPELAGEVLGAVAAFAQDGLAVQEGKMVAELKQVQYAKGTAIAALLAASPFLGRRPVFIGDDLTDESGFRFVNVQGGVSVKVGPAEGATEAQHRLVDPAALRAELGALLGAG
jgi:trehalose 6-phosphate phosphatase